MGCYLRDDSLLAAFLHLEDITAYNSDLKRWLWEDMTAFMLKRWQNKDMAAYNFIWRDDSMVAAFLHLEDTTAHNGGLAVFPGKDFSNHLQTNYAL